MDESQQPRLSASPGGPPPPVMGGRYRVERLVARGGMAAVYLAEHVALRRMVALKVLTPPPEGEEGTGGFERRFRLEAETLATLDHPNIVTLYDYGQAEDGRFFLAMEYIDGPRYTDLIAGGAISPERTISLLLQVCSALRYAHKRGVIHRDLKPSNLLIRQDGEGQDRVKVVDFGLVKVAEIDQSLTREGLVLGSPHCMAPEQVKGLEVDARADVYAIGVLLFRSLTGAYPFHGPNATATMIAHINEPIPAFSAVVPGHALPARLEAAVRRCLAKSSSDRFPDVSALMEELQACLQAPAELDTSQSLARAETPSIQPSSRSATPWIVGAALLGLAMIAGVMAWAFRGPGPAMPPPEAAVPAPEAAMPPPEAAVPAPEAAVPAPPVASPTVLPAAAGPAPEAAPPEPAPEAAPPAAAAAPAATKPAASASPRPTPPVATPPAATPKAPAATPPAATPPVTAPKPPTEETPPEGYMPLPDDFN